MMNKLLLIALLSNPITPNSKYTPGVIYPSADKEKICTVGYAYKTRNVSKSKKNFVFELYGIDKNSDKFEIDHLISLELGGSNDIKNLWPESYTTPKWNAREKDKLENKMHSMVCSGILDLKTAQDEISSDWISAYKKYIGDK